MAAIQRPFDHIKAARRPFPFLTAPSLHCPSLPFPPRPSKATLA
ncbi:hypothetical protein E2C01_089383 [Portunus trituberculatus]|uniref:Uncharacterized protein n=1 Tax=Portunus trituberculatus TaxID=210409 RepID=A0A5B7JI11_PORTR|nr:hypothetical protein [Portunus trituberculatus]